MAKITRIKAGDGPREKDSTPTITRKKVVVADKKTTKQKRAQQKAAEQKLAQSAKTTAKSDQSARKPFILFRPFVALGHYLRDSWKELRQVRWPSLKATWKMVLAVLFYSAFFMILISLLDLFFTWLFNLILNR